jgi:hypothetical protein
MTEQVLKDNRGIVIGRIQADSSGVMVIKDHRGLIKGRYDPRTNITKDDRGIHVGTGNLLSSLLR